MSVITAVEQAICERLKNGLGRMVDDVRSYGGELDAGLDEVIRVLPAAWVTFGGIQQTKATNTTRRKFKASARFVVIVGDKNIRSEADARHGGVLNEEVGTNNLVFAVRRLLSGQDLGLSIDYLSPGRVRTLFHTQIEREAMSVFACEFDTAWIEDALENGSYPTPTIDTNADAIFTRYSGTLDQPADDWLRTHISYNNPNTALNPDAEDIITYD